MEGERVGGWGSDEMAAVAAVVLHGRHINSSSS